MSTSVAAIPPPKLTEEEQREAKAAAAEAAQRQAIEVCKAMIAMTSDFRVNCTDTDALSLLSYHAGG